MVVMARASVHPINISSVTPSLNCFQSSRKAGSVSMTTAFCIPPGAAAPLRLNLSSFLGRTCASAMFTGCDRGRDSKVLAAMGNTLGFSEEKIFSRIALPAAMFERFTDEAVTVLMLSQDEARRLSHNFIGTEHLLLGLLRDDASIAAKALFSLNFHLEDIRSDVVGIEGRGGGFVTIEVPFMPRAKRVLELAIDEALQLGHCCVAPEHILLGLIREGEGAGVRRLMRDFIGYSKKLDEIRETVIEMIRKDKPAEVSADANMDDNNVDVLLEDYGTDLTEIAKEGKLDPVIGRQELIDRVIRILCRQTKNIPVLIGENGARKTAIVEGLAHRIANGDVPATIQGKKIIKLDVRLLVAREENREERLKKLMDVTKRSDDIILFIDEGDAFLGADDDDDDIEGAIDAEIVLRGSISRGGLKFQCICAAAHDWYITLDPLLQRYVEPVNVTEPLVDETIEILKGIRGQYETHHNVRYTDESLVAAAKLSHNFFSDWFLPDKAIDMMDYAGSNVRFGLPQSHAQVQEEVKTLQSKLGHVTSDKLKAIDNEDFEKARELCDREADLKAQIWALNNKEINE